MLLFIKKCDSIGSLVYYVAEINAVPYSKL